MTEISLRQSIVITGASSGIGKACALHFDRLGFTVFAGVRKGEDARALEGLASGDLRPIELDVTSETQVAAAREKVDEAVGSEGLTALVNNAGIPLGGPLEFLSMEDFRREVDVNLFGAVSVTQAFLPLIRSARGRIVNISSMSGFIALPFMSPYAATKFALRAVTDSLRVELRPWGIPVSIIEIGDVRTRIWEKSLAVIEKAAGDLSPIGRELYGPVVEIREWFRPHGIEPAEVARVVEKAVSSRRPKARYVVGKDARFMDVVRRLPVRLRDALIASRLPNYGPARQ